MTYLLDVNALLAMRYTKHVHHLWVTSWIRRRQDAYGVENVVFATCAITELGFVRIAGGSSGLADGVASARCDLKQIKAREKFIFLQDHLGAEYLPAWVTKAAQTTDGHLLLLARAHYAELATLDRGIAGAELIRDDSEPPPGVRDPGVWQSATLADARGDSSRAG